MFHYNSLCSIEPIPKVNEHVLLILSAKESTGKELFKLVENSFLKNNIDVKKCVGFSAWLTKESPQQLHVWFYTRKLNLVLIDVAFTTSRAISLFGLLNSCSVFPFSLIKEWIFGGLLLQTVVFRT